MKRLSADIRFIRWLSFCADQMGDGVAELFGQLIVWIGFHPGYRPSETPFAEVHCKRMEAIRQESGQTS